MSIPFKLGVKRDVDGVITTLTITTTEEGRAQAEFAARFMEANGATTPVEVIVVTEDELFSDSTEEPDDKIGPNSTLFPDRRGKEE